MDFHKILHVGTLKHLDVYCKLMCRSGCKICSYVSWYAHIYYLIYNVCVYYTIAILHMNYHSCCNHIQYMHGVLSPHSPTDPPAENYRT